MDAKKFLLFAWMSLGACSASFAMESMIFESIDSSILKEFSIYRSYNDFIKVNGVDDIDRYKTALFDFIVTSTTAKYLVIPKFGVLSGDNFYPILVALVRENQKLLEGKKIIMVEYNLIAANTLLIENRKDEFKDVNESIFIHKGSIPDLVKSVHALGSKDYCFFVPYKGILAEKLVTNIFAFYEKSQPILGHIDLISLNRPYNGESFDGVDTSLRPLSCAEKLAILIGSVKIEIKLTQEGLFISNINHCNETALKVIGTFAQSNQATIPLENIAGFLTEINFHLTLVPDLVNESEVQDKKTVEYLILDPIISKADIY